MTDSLEQIYDRDVIISKLRRQVCSLEERLARSERAAGGDAPEPAGLAPLLLAFDEAGQLETSSDTSRAEPVPAGFTMLAEEDGAGAFEAISRVEDGFWVHPRPGRGTFGCIGPFEGAPPVLVTGSVQTEHPDSPPVSFTLDLIRTRSDDDTLLEAGRRRTKDPLSWVSVDPMRRKVIVATFPADELRWSRWAILVGTRAPDRAEAEFAWATFKAIRCFHIDGGRRRQTIVA